MEKSKDITIYDIAKALEVSPSTVSRALNDDPTVSKKTRKKVYETAVNMGYRSNQFARSLRQQQSMTIGVMVFDLTSGFVVPVLSGIEKAATEAGYGIIIMDSAQNRDKEVSNARALFLRRVDGLLVFPSPALAEPDHFRPFTEKNIPVIFLGRAGPIAQSTSVFIDNERCGYLATRHLIGQGCRRIAHITPGSRDEIYRQRYNGYRAALAEAGLPLEDDLVIVAELTEEDSFRAARRLTKLRPLPDGLFVPDDLAAAVCIRSFLDAGLRVPQDIAVVGFNNDAIGKLIRPALTTIGYPGQEMGETAAGILIRHLKGAGSADRISVITIRADLIVRQSSLRQEGVPAK